MRTLICATGLLVFVSLQATDAVARPDYSKRFSALYPALKEQTEAFNKCTVCHFGAEKSNLNDYGKALRETLGAPKVAIPRVIDNALRRIEDKPSSFNEKTSGGLSRATFGALIKAGQLPGKNPGDLR